MKIRANKNEQVRLREVLEKHKNVNEGLIKWIFKKVLTSRIKSDAGIMGKINAADKAMDDLKDIIADREKKGLYVDPYFKQMVGQG